MEPERIRGEVIGFRAWKLDGYRLKPLMRGIPMSWSLEVTQAQCFLPEVRSSRHRLIGLPQDHPTPSLPMDSRHRAPEPLCQCGLHALYAPANMSGSAGGAVGGAILAWGRIEIYESGFRAEFARPIVLGNGRGPVQERIQALAEEMQIPCVPFNELEATALRFGQPVPKEMRPEWERRQPYHIGQARSRPGPLRQFPPNLYLGRPPGPPTQRELREKMEGLGKDD